MSPSFAIWARECKSYLQSNSAWCVFAVTAAITGMLFSLSLRELDNTFEYLPAVVCKQLLLVICLPVSFFSMSLFPEEIESGTLEGLLTTPVSDWNIVIGKFLSSLTMVTLSWLISLLVMPIYLKCAAPPPTWSPLSLAGGLFTLFLSTTVWCAAGCLISLISRHQAIAGVISFAVTLICAVLFSGTFLIFDNQAVIEMTNLPDAARGIADTRVFFASISLTWFFLFCAAHRLQIRDWVVKNN